MKKLLLIAGVVCALALFTASAEASHGCSSGYGYGGGYGGGYYPSHTSGYYGGGHAFHGRTTFYAPRRVRSFHHGHVHGHGHRHHHHGTSLRFGRLRIGF